VTRYTLHVPVFDNAGRAIPEDSVTEIEDALTTIAGGWTMIPSAVGGWRGEDRSYRELVNLYHVDSDEDGTEAWLIALARKIAESLEQEAVYLTRQEIEAFLVAPAREEIPA
jgi:hypothetical protein